MPEQKGYQGFRRQSKFLLFMNAGRLALTPTQIESAAIGGAVAQIQIDQALVGHAQLFRNTLEISNGIFIQTNGDLLFQLRCIRVFACLAEVVFFSHQ